MSTATSEKMTVYLRTEVTYNPQVTDPEALSNMLDCLLETALSTPGITEEYGDPEIGGFLVSSRPRRDKPASPAPWDLPPFAADDPQRPRTIADTHLFDVPGMGTRLRRVCYRLFTADRLQRYITTRFWSIPDLPVEAFAAYSVEQYLGTTGCGEKAVSVLQRYLSRLGIRLSHHHERDALGGKDLG